MNFNNPKKNLELSLNDKIELAKTIIKSAIQRFPQNQLYLAWTGGKDSTTMLWLYREVTRELKIEMPESIFIDEGDTFDEISTHVDQIRNKWNIRIEIVKNTDVSDKANTIGAHINVSDLNKRNQMEIKKIGFSEKHFPFDPESYVGNHLMKTVPMNIFIETHNVSALSTAIRWDEQDARKEEDYFSPRKSPDHMRIHPILHFKERDIWDLTHKNNIPFCSLYYRGYRSLGTKGSTHTVSDLPAWEQDLENSPERLGRNQGKEEIMGQLRALGYM